MTDNIIAGAEKDAEAAAKVIKDSAGNVIEHADAEVAANIATARDRVHGLGHDVAAVAHWLVETTRGAIVDVGEAIRWIGHKL